MILSEAKEILKENGYRLVESMEASYDSVNEICAKNGFEVIDSDVDPDTWVIYQKGWEDEIEDAPGFSNLINDLEELAGFKWMNDDTDISAIVCWNSNLA